MSEILQLLILLGAVGAVAYYRLSPMAWTLTIGAVLFMVSGFGSIDGWLGIIVWSLFAISALIANHTKFRRDVLSAKVFAFFKRVLPPMSTTEKEALEAGDVWWDGDLFKGQPDWQKWHQIKKPELTKEEQDFIDNQVETLCAMIDEWKIIQEDVDLPKEVWDYLKKERFFGMLIPKEYGGIEFSALAQSSVISKIASRSSSAAVNAMVPNSLGPAELLLHYGTEEQKQHYLPRLANGDEIPCFGLTAPQAGSDAGSIPDTAVVCKGMHEGKEVIGMRMNFDKRYITLAPVATVVGLAFKLYDPEHLIGDVDDYGITVALIPATHPGVEIGDRHYPLNMAFQNGPIRGKDVFVPIDWIIGGPKMAGKGWRMLVECLSAGRAISLPSLATATGKLSYLTTGAYAKVRKQFKTSIGYFEGVQEAMARIGGYTYMLEAARITTAHAVDMDVKPSVVSAIAKYHMTEISRKVIMDAMDVHAGKGIILGPRNYLGRAYQGAPIGITVEGANILTRNLMIFGQGAVRCHPYVLSEMEATQEADPNVGLKKFDEILLSHIGYGISNFAKTLAFGMTNGAFIKAPYDGPTAKYYKQLTRMSAALALVADISMLMLGGELKRKERLSARLGDVLSALYLGSSVLKYYQDEGSNAADLPFVHWSMQKLLNDIQVAFTEFFANFPNKWLGIGLKAVVFPLGLTYKLPADDLGQTISLEMMKPSAFRDRITKYVFIGKEADDSVGRVEQAFLKSVAVAPIEKKLNKAIKAQKFAAAMTFEETVANALKAKVITDDEANELIDAYEASKDAIQVDEFAPEYLTGDKSECQDKAEAKVA